MPGCNWIDWGYGLARIDSTPMVFLNLNLQDYFTMILPDQTHNVNSEFRTPADIVERDSG